MLQPAPQVECAPLAEAYHAVRARIPLSKGADKFALIGAMLLIGVIVLYHQVRSAKRPEGTVQPRTRVAVTMEEVPGKGWVAHAAEVRATAQGETESEALANLRELLSTYPETLAEVKAAAGTRHVELVTV